MELADLIFKGIVACAAVYSGYRSWKNARAIEVVRSDVNDKMQQFIKVSGGAEHAKGVIEGKKTK